MSHVDSYALGQARANLVTTTQPPWWLNPIAAVVLVAGTTALYAATRSDDAYRTWGTVRYLTADSLVQIAVGMISLILGVKISFAVSRSTGHLSRTVLDPASIVKMYRVLYRLTILGYALWLLFGVMRGLTAGMVLTAVTLQPGAVSALKLVAAPAMILAVALIANTERKWQPK